MDTFATRTQKTEMGRPRGHPRVCRNVGRRFRPLVAGSQERSGSCAACGSEPYIKLPKHGRVLDGKGARARNFQKQNRLHVSNFPKYRLSLCAKRNFFVGDCDVADMPICLLRWHRDVHIPGGVRCGSGHQQHP